MTNFGDFVHSETMSAREQQIVFVNLVSRILELKNDPDLMDDEQWQLMVRSREFEAAKSLWEELREIQE